MGVRGLGVRGLGDQQWKAREMTCSKIVSFLMVSPFTFEQLWRVSRIHRNALGKRLQYLIKEGVVFNHEYSIPYTKEFYGYMYKYSVQNPYTPSLYGHTYYLLNCSEPACGGLINFYYNNKAREKVDSTVKPLQKTSGNRPKLSASHDSMKEIQKKLDQNRDRVMEMSEWEYREYWQMSIEFEIFMSRAKQENKIAAVKHGIRLPSELDDISISTRKEVMKVIDYYLKKRCSLMDILIKCSTDKTVILTSQYVADILEGDLFSYNVLWHIMREERMLKF